MDTTWKIKQLYLGGTEEAYHHNFIPLQRLPTSPCLIKKDLGFLEDDFPFWWFVGDTPNSQQEPPIGTHLFWHSFLVWQFFLVGDLRDTPIQTHGFFASCIMMHHGYWWNVVHELRWMICCALHIKHVLFDHFFWHLTEAVFALLFFAQMATETKEKWHLRKVWKQARLLNTWTATYPLEHTPQDKKEIHEELDLLVQGLGYVPGLCLENA